MTEPQLFVPPPIEDFGPCDVAKFYGNFLAELQFAGFSTREREKLLHRKMLGRLCCQPQFFLHRFVPCVTAAVRACFAGHPRPRALELGCGSGSLSLLLALLGAEVVAIDLDADLISACGKRAALYGGQGCKLDLTFICADALKFDYAQIAPRDAVCSVYAFNLMPSPRYLLASVAAALAPGGQVRIVDGNRGSVYNRCFRRRPVLSPAEMVRELRSCGLSCEELSFTGILPPAVASSPRLLRLGQAIERRASAWRFFPSLAVSYTVAAGKPAGG